MLNEKWKVENFNKRAYDEIKRQILSKELEPGARLVDSQLAMRYGISRTPVRDAIRRLVNEGYVVPNATKGYSVYKATKHDIMEILELRRILETAIITKLIMVLIPVNRDYYAKEIRKIESKLLSDMSSGRDFRTYDEEFHDSIAGLCQNGRIIAIYEQNRDQSKVFRSVGSLSEERTNEVNNSHKRIITSIKNENLNSALEATNEHVDFTLNKALIDFC